LGERNRLLRKAVSSVVVAFALVAPSAAFASDHGSQSQHGKPGPVTTVTSPGSSQSAQGVVQSVSPSAVVVKQLDGKTITVPVDRKSQVFVNNKTAHWADVRPGFVLAASWKAGKPATTLRFVRP
jgi:hypothetical protein